MCLCIQVKYCSLNRPIIPAQLCASLIQPYWMSSITVSQILWKASKYSRANNWSSHVWESRFSNRYILQGVVFMQVERCVPGNSLYQNRTTIKSATRQTPIDTDRQNNWSPKDHHVLWFHFHHQSISTEYPVSIHCTILSAQSEDDPCITKALTLP